MKETEMMMSPEGYLDGLKDSGYEELVARRDELMEYVKAFERHEIPEEEFLIQPGPDVRYQMYLEYLAPLCTKIAEAYNQEFMQDQDEE